MEGRGWCLWEADLAVFNERSIYSGTVSKVASSTMLWAPPGLRRVEVYDDDDDDDWQHTCLCL